MSTHKDMDNNSKIEDVLPTMHDPEEFLRCVLITMDECEREHGKGKARVRIGITGTGQYPNHKVAYIDTDGIERDYGAFYGTNPFRDVSLGVEKWSHTTDPDTREDVRRHLGEVRRARRR